MESLYKVRSANSPQCIFVGREYREFKIIHGHALNWFDMAMTPINIYKLLRVYFMLLLVSSSYRIQRV